MAFAYTPPSGFTGIGGTWNPSDATSNVTFSNGNLTFTTTTSTGWKGARGTVGVSSGKVYWEVHIDSGTSGFDVAMGISKSGVSISNPWFFGGSTNDGMAYNGPNGNKRATPSGDTAYGSTWGANNTDVVMVALDMTAGKIWWGLNGVWQASGDPAAGTNEAYSGITGTQYPTMAAYEQYQITATFDAPATVNANFLAFM